MTQEEKQLLLIDLCARLAYGVTYYHDTDNVVTPKQILGLTEINNILLGIGDNIKPYLRPMSSMTEKEDKEFAMLQTEAGNSGFLYPSNAANLIRFLNAHHLDYNGLIEKGLALPASEGMYE